MGYIVINVGDCLQRSVYGFLLYKAVADGAMFIIDAADIQRLGAAADSLMIRLRRSSLDLKGTRIAVCIPRDFGSGAVRRQKNSVLYNKLVVRELLAEKLYSNGISCPVDLLFFDNVKNRNVYEGFKSCENGFDKSFTDSAGAGEGLLPSSLSGSFTSDLNDPNTLSFYEKARKLAQAELDKTEDPEAKRDTEIEKIRYRICSDLLKERKIHAAKAQLDGVSPGGAACDMLVMLRFIIDRAREDAEYETEQETDLQEKLDGYFRSREAIRSAYSRALSGYIDRLGSENVVIAADTGTEVEGGKTERFFKGAMALQEKFSAAYSEFMNPKAFFTAEKPAGGDPSRKKRVRATFEQIKEKWERQADRLHEEINRAKSSTAKAASDDSLAVYSETCRSAPRRAERIAADDDISGLRADLIYDRNKKLDNIRCSESFDTDSKMKKTEEELDRADKGVSHILSYATMWQTGMLIRNSIAALAAFILVFCIAQSYTTSSWVFYATSAAAAVICLLSVPAVYIYLKGGIKRRLKRLKRHLDAFFVACTDALRSFEDRSGDICVASEYAHKLGQLDEETNKKHDAAKKAQLHKDMIGTHLENARNIRELIYRASDETMIDNGHIRLNIELSPAYGEFYAVEPEKGWDEG